MHNVSWIRNQPQMLVYKHENYFGGHFCDVKTQFWFLFQVNTFYAKMTQKDVKLKDSSKRFLVQSIGGVKTQNTIKISITMKTLNIMIKGFENSELNILECMQNYCRK